MKQDNTLIFLYFDFIANDGVCLKVQTIRKELARGLNPSIVKVYDIFHGILVVELTYEYV